MVDVLFVLFVLAGAGLTGDSEIAEWPLAAVAEVATACSTRSLNPLSNSNFLEPRRAARVC